MFRSGTRLLLFFSRYMMFFERPAAVFMRPRTSLHGMHGHTTIHTVKKKTNEKAQFIP